MGAYLRKLVASGDFLFAAAGRSGFVLISKSTSERDDARSLEFAGEDAYSLSVIESSGDFLVYIATQYDDSGITRGRLRILRVGSTSTTIEATRNVAARVYAIAAAEGIQSSGVHTVLVGTSCDKLYRFDVSSPYTAFGTPTADWSITNVPLFHRDIVIHRAGTSDDRAYLAAWRRGVFGFDITGSALTQLPAPWPIRPSSAGGSTDPSNSIGLALHSPTNRSAICLGPPYAEERQFGGKCEVLIPCVDDDDTTGLYVGVQIWTVEDAELPSFEAAFDSENFDNVAGIQAASFRVVDEDRYFLDVSTPDNGVELVRVDASATPAGVVLIGAWAVEEGLPLPTYDQIVVQEDTLYVTNEGSLTTFNLDVAGPADTLTEAASVSTTIPVLDASGNVSKNTLVGLTGFPEPQARLYGSAFPGITFFNVSGAQRLLPRKASEFLSTGGRGLLAVATRGLGGAFFSPPVVPRWLIVPLYGYDLNGSELIGGLKIWNVGTATRPSDPQVFQVGGFQVQGTFVDANDVTQQLPFASLGHVAVVRISDAELCVFASYAAKTYRTSPQNSGLMALSVKLLGSEQTVIAARGLAAAYTFDPEEFTPPDNPWRVTLDTDVEDPDEAYVYACFGCNGIAQFVYPKSNPYDITLRALRPTPAGCAVQVVVGPPNGTGGKYLYVALSTGGLGVLPDSENFASATWSLYPTRLQPIGIALDPSDTTKRRVFVADGRAGTHLLDFTGVM